MIRGVVLFCCCLVVLTPSSTNALSDEQKQKIHEHIGAIKVVCLKDNPITENDINDIRARKVPSGENTSCFLACMSRQIGVMNDKGLLEEDKALELVKKYNEDADKLKKIEEFMQACSSVNTATVSDGEKGCERAMLAYKCMIENASRFGFDV